MPKRNKYDPNPRFMFSQDEMEQIMFHLPEGWVKYKLQCRINGAIQAKEWVG